MGKISKKITDLDYQLTLNYSFKSFVIYFLITLLISTISIYLLFSLTDSIPKASGNTLITSLTLGSISGIIISASKFLQHLELKEYLAFIELYKEIETKFRDSFNLNELSELYNSLIYELYPKYYKRQYYIKISSLADRITERIKCIQLHPELNETK